MRGEQDRGRGQYREKTRGGQEGSKRLRAKGAAVVGQRRVVFVFYSSLVAINKHRRTVVPVLGSKRAKKKKEGRGEKTRCQPKDARLSHKASKKREKTGVPGPDRRCARTL